MTNKRIAPAPKRSTVEWTQAILSLLFLSCVYFFVNASQAQNLPLPYEMWVNGSWQEHRQGIPDKNIWSVWSKYWNEKEWYWFTIAKDDFVKKFERMQESDDSVGVSKNTVPKIFSDASVRVYYYKWKTVQEVMSQEKSDQASERTYASLSSWTVVIEWDLSSDSARMILTTLHNR
jgi:hypothetical protein